MDTGTPLRKDNRKLISVLRGNSVFYPPSPVCLWAFDGNKGSTTLKRSVGATQAISVYSVNKSFAVL